jgi:hypothetical protein
MSDLVVSPGQWLAVAAFLVLAVAAAMVVAVAVMVTGTPRWAVPPYLRRGHERR